MVFDKVMTRILTQKIAAYIQKTKVYAKRLKKQEGGLTVKADFLCGGVS